MLKNGLDTLNDREEIVFDRTVENKAFKESMPSNQETQPSVGN